MGKTLWCAIVFPADFPLVRGEKAGDGAAETAEGDTVPTELHY